MNSNLTITVAKERSPVFGRVVIEATGVQDRPTFLLGEYPLGGSSNYVPVYQRVTNQVIGKYPLGGP